MGTIIGFLTGKIAGPLFAGTTALLLVALAITVGVYHFELSNETARADRLDDSINNTSTGWAVRNAQCETNVKTLGSGLDRMAGDIKKLGDDTAAANAAAAKLMANAASEARGARVRADQVLALPRPAPADACKGAARVLKGMAP